MKCFFYILALLLILALAGRYFYGRFIEKMKISAVVDFSKVLLTRKVFYTVDYSGVIFSGVYDLRDGNIKSDSNGKVTIRTFSKNGNFGIEVLKKGKKVKEFSFDLITQKLKIEA